MGQAGECLGLVVVVVVVEEEVVEVEVVVEDCRPKWASCLASLVLTHDTPTHPGSTHTHTHTHTHSTTLAPKNLFMHKIM